MRNRTEARVRRGISGDRFLIHLRDERKQNLLFLLNMRIHFTMKLLSQLGDFFQFSRPITALRRDLGSHVDQSWKLLTNTMVMNADDVLNQAPEGQSLRVQSRATTLLPFRIGEFFEDLIDRKLQFPARSFER